ncbi:hypothetical protein [Janthinobacterium sp. ROICE36]|nr:hypothetical protein [Janthinobacterium sp. ROICE36]
MPGLDACRNDPVQRAALMRRDITSQYKELSYRHRHALLAVLAQALQAD